jgi:DNA-binding beta-propeller fold protein YncE
MRFFLVKWSIAGAASISLLSACSASQAQIVPARDGSAATSRVKAPAVLADGSDSSGKILFVNDGANNTIARFTYPAGKYLGQITGLVEPRGLCSDAKGDVWVTDTGSSTIEKYSHNGRHIGTLHDDGFEPYSCAVDPQSGNLAVANILSNSAGSGNVAIFTNASGKPAFYPGDIHFAFYVAYARSGGTLYVDGLDALETFQYASFANGTFKSIPIQGVTVKFPGPLAPADMGNAIDVADQQSTPPTIYRVDRSGRLKGSTELHCSNTSGSCGLEAMIIEGHHVLVDALGPGVEGFKYPTGGDVVMTIGAGQLSQPYGLAMSPGPSE